MQPTQRPKYQNLSYGQQQETVLDLIIKTDSGTHTIFGVPSNLEVVTVFSNGEYVTISDNKDAMSAEIATIKQKSQDTIDSVQYHKEVISICDAATGVLNPEYAERQERDAEFTKLKGKVDSLSGKMDLILERLSAKLDTAL